MPLSSCCMCMCMWVYGGLHVIVHCACGYMMACMLLCIVHVGIWWRACYCSCVGMCRVHAFLEKQARAQEAMLHRGSC